MADHTDVPLHAAADPGIPQGQVSGAENRIVGDKVLPINLIIQGPQATAQIGHKGGLQIIVFQYGCMKFNVVLSAIVAILHLIREDILQIAISHKQFIVLVQTCLHLGMHGIAHGRQIAASVQMSTLEDFLFKTKLSHRITPFPAKWH